MLRRLLPLFCASLLFMASTALAAGPKTHLPGDLTMQEALTVQNAALEKARAQGVPMNIAVVDAGGHLKTFVRQDGAFLGSIDVSIKKAVTARYFNMPTSALGAAAQPGKELFGIEATNGGLVIFGGGELLVRQGVVVGATHRCCALPGHGEGSAAAPDAKMGRPGLSHSWAGGHST